MPDLHKHTNSHLHLHRQTHIDTHTHTGRPFYKFFFFKKETRLKNKEYIDMVLVCGEAADNGRAIRRIYPHRLTPTNTLFAKVIQRLGEKGSFAVNRADCGAPRSSRVSNFKEDVLHRVKKRRQRELGTLRVKFVCHIVPSGRFCMSSNYTLTIPRGYMQ